MIANFRKEPFPGQKLDLKTSSAVAFSYLNTFAFRSFNRTPKTQHQIIEIALIFFSLNQETYNMKNLSKVSRNKSRNA
jgi:hypothetical protein